MRSAVQSSHLLCTGIRLASCLLSGTRPLSSCVFHRAQVWAARVQSRACHWVRSLVIKAQIFESLSDTWLCFQVTLVETRSPCPFCLPSCISCLRHSVRQVKSKIADQKTAQSGARVRQSQTHAFTAFIILIGGEPVSLHDSQLANQRKSLRRSCCSLHEDWMCLSTSNLILKRVAFKPCSLSQRLPVLEPAS